MIKKMHDKWLGWFSEHVIIGHTIIQVCAIAFGLILTLIMYKHCDWYKKYFDWQLKLFKR